MRLLLFSNSRNEGEEYLEYTLPYIKNFLRNKNIKGVFIPYAGVSVGFDNYFIKVSEKLKEAGIFLTSLHQASDPHKELDTADLIIVGGGNTFCLLKSLQEKNLLEKIRRRVKKGVPYIGWSAGANLACPTIKTTNDMPIVEPQNFDALNLIPFQINPHYTDFNPPGHAGETREMRIEEFILMNRNVFVAGLRESMLFKIDDNAIELHGSRSCRIFKFDQKPFETYAGENIDFLMQ